MNRGIYHTYIWNLDASKDKPKECITDAFVRTTAEVDFDVAMENTDRNFAAGGASLLFLFYSSAGADARCVNGHPRGSTKEQQQRREEEEELCFHSFRSCIFAFTLLLTHGARNLFSRRTLRLDGHAQFNS